MSLPKELITLYGDVDAALESVPVSAFSSQRVALLGHLGEELKRLGASNPDIATFAFWCRRRHVEAMATRYPEPLRGRGTVLHIAPGNVPMNFAFSWALAFLSGCSSVVRLPNGYELETSSFLEALKRVTDGGIADAFCRYESSGEVTALLSQRVSARMLWGSDETVQSIRRIPSAPDCLDLPFPDRYSLSLMSAKHVNQLDDRGLHTLVRNFFSDTMAFDQNACSSPRGIIWFGSDSEIEKASEKFWMRLEDITRKRYTLAPVHAADRLVSAMTVLSTSREATLSSVIDAALLRLELPYSDFSTLREFRCGLFAEFRIQDLDQMQLLNDRRLQTLTTAVEPDLKLEEASRSWVFSRVVPVGSALAMGSVWDGLDIVRCLTVARGGGLNLG